MSLKLIYLANVDTFHILLLLKIVTLFHAVLYVVMTDTLASLHNVYYGIPIRRC